MILCLGRERSNEKEVIYVRCSHERAGTGNCKRDDSNTQGDIQRIENKDVDEGYGGAEGDGKAGSRSALN